MEEGCKVIRMPFHYFHDSALIQKTFFLTENLSDATFYRRVAKIYLRWKKLKGIKIIFQPQLGGGATTARTYQLIQDRQEHFCLCFLDSDKKSPNSPLGETAKAVKRIDDLNKPLCEYFVINVR
jgi:hypothetical protein